MQGTHLNQFLVGLERRVKEVERRLSALEQPLWKISDGSAANWNACSEGNLCRCGIKSVNCWNIGLNAIPFIQIVPVDIVTL